MPEQITPEPIMQVATGFMAAKHLFAASELGLFETLADGPATLDGLAARTGLTPRATRISADAMVALGLLDNDGDRYRNGAAASAFLTGRGPGDLRPFLRFWDKLSYPTWEGLADTLAHGPSTEIFDLDTELQEISAAGIEAILAGPANALAATFDFSARRRLLDVGGGTGSWSIAAVRRHEHLSATVLELPVQADVARKRVSDQGLADRVDVVTGDAMGEELPTGCDVFLLANLVHYWSPQENRELLARVRRAADPGAHLLVADFWTDPTHTQPVVAALMAGEFAVHLRNGDVYSAEEGSAWLADTGWQMLGHSPLAGPVSVLVAEAI